MYSFIKKDFEVRNRFSLVLLDVFVDTSKPCFHTRQSLKTITAIKDPNNKNKLVKDSSHIPNIVNEHFASVRSRLANKIPSSQQHYLDFVNKNMFPMPSFFFQPLTYDCVKTEILSLPSNKSHGLYSSPTKLLKCSIDIIAPVLSEELNISISLRRYPTKFKLSKIVPVFKSYDETNPNNYRPISLLSNFNRILERLMYTQYGFRKGHSTQHAILDIVNAIQTNMNQGLYSCGVFVDLKKAFDIVDHNIRLDKLNFYP